MATLPRLTFGEFRAIVEEVDARRRRWSWRVERCVDTTGTGHWVTVAEGACVRPERARVRAVRALDAAREGFSRKAKFRAEREVIQ